MTPRALCGFCDRPPRGHAEINGVPYCHEGPSPTCYEQAWQVLYTAPSDTLETTDELADRHIDEAHRS